MAIDCRGGNGAGALDEEEEDEDAGSLVFEEDDDLNMCGRESSDDESDGSFEVVIDRSKRRPSKAERNRATKRRG